MKSDYFVFLSSYVNEAQPLVLYESICSGVVPLASPIGEIPEMLDVSDSDLLIAGEDLPRQAFSAINYFVTHNRRSVLLRQLLNHSFEVQQHSLAQKKLLFASIASTLLPQS